MLADDEAQGWDRNPALLSGGSENDAIFGYGGSDYLSGGDGNDTLSGGAGSNYGWGNDIYLFGRGLGQDTIVDYDGTSGNLDTVRLAADVLPADVYQRRQRADGLRRQRHALGRCRQRLAEHAEHAQVENPVQALVAIEGKHA